MNFYHNYSGWAFKIYRQTLYLYLWVAQKWFLYSYQMKICVKFVIRCHNWEKKNIFKAKMKILSSSCYTNIMQFKPILGKYLWDLPRSKMWIFILNQLQWTIEKRTLYSLDIYLLLSSKDAIPEITMYFHWALCLLFYLFISFSLSMLYYIQNHGYRI